MARLPRVYVEGILYYVTSKSGHNEDLFLDSADYKEYISLIDRYKRQYGFKLYAYTLLPKHLHMLIELKNNIGISNIMHDINSLYTKAHNGRYGKKGHLFQQRFRAVLAEKQPYLLELIRHIHLNPVRVKLVSEPCDYQYSSHLKYINKADRENLDMRSEIEEVFGILKGREARFDEYVKTKEHKQINELKKSVHKERILGSTAFIENIKKQIEDSIREQKKIPLPKRIKALYGILGVTFLITLASAINYSKQTDVLKSEYGKTLAMYESTLEFLRNERESALKQDKSVEDYEWKIGLAEKAMEELKLKRERSAQLAENFEGYTWSIKLTLIKGPAAGFPLDDMLSFSNNRVSLKNISEQGFGPSKYSRRLLKDGRVGWETMQINGKGETISWRGEWDGKAMKGVISKKSLEGTISDFSFISIGDRVKV
ncbi:MAG: transposase [Candidatus Omnitrophota bacterium]